MPRTGCLPGFNPQLHRLTRLEVLSGARSGVYAVKRLWGIFVVLVLELREGNEQGNKPVNAGLNVKRGHWSEVKGGFR